MDSVEKRVIRWKRHLIASSIILTDDAIEKLVARDLMWSDTLDQIKGDFSNFGRMWKYLELLMNASIDHSAFESFCDFLEDQHPWLGEELRVELMVEKHQLQVDEYMRKEASQLVHRFFGTNKKISERDKKRLEDLVAVRAQVAKEVWRRTMDGTRRSLELQTTSKQEREEKLDALIRNVEDFVDAQKKKISRYSLDALRSDKIPAVLLKRDSETMKRHSGVSSHQVYQLEAAIEKLQLVTTMCVLNFEGLSEEKARALEALGVTDDDDAPLDKELKTALARLTAQANKAETRADAEEQKLRQAEQQLEEAKKRYEEHLKDRDHNIRFLASSLEKAQEKFSISETELREANDRLEMANADLAKFKVKSRYLEKTRHYGYGYFSDGYPTDQKVTTTTAKGEFPRIGGSPRRQVGHQSPNANRKVVTRRPANRSGQSV